MHVFTHKSYVGLHMHICSKSNYINFFIYTCFLLLFMILFVPLSYLPVKSREGIMCLFICLSVYLSTSFNLVFHVHREIQL